MWHERASGVQPFHGAAATERLFQRMHGSPIPPCSGATEEIRFTIDAEGNILLPMDWRGVLVNRDSVPVARLLRGSTDVEAFEGSGQPLQVPGNSFLASYSVKGGELPPLFDPQSDPDAIGGATFFGSADAPETVLRLARRSSTFQQCSGGPNDGLPCIAAGRLPERRVRADGMRRAAPMTGAPAVRMAIVQAASAAQALFDFSTRLWADIGPVRLQVGACLGGSNEGATCSDDSSCTGGQCGSFDIAALDPVPLDGFNETADALAFVVAEPIANEDLNGDGDELDDVVKLLERGSGVVPHDRVRR